MTKPTCQASRDGECNAVHCPQEKSWRTKCPLDNTCPDCQAGEDAPACVRCQGTGYVKATPPLLVWISWCDQCGNADYAYNNPPKKDIVPGCPKCETGPEFQRTEGPYELQTADRAKLVTIGLGRAGSKRQRKDVSGASRRKGPRKRV